MMRKWLKDMRKAKGMSMASLTREIDISESYYCQIENGTRNASVTTAKKIAAALGFDWQRFYEDEKTPTQNG
ncbi:MAG: helix-turn-helix transcriptional regulator [Clostridia bacterium]|nr:helix-turn-helix transcriptional regulator [Clostridia bacterium]